MVKSGDILADVYQIEEIIGSGGGGEVYRASHLRLGKAVALKRIKDEVAGQISSRAEADIIKSLKHSYLPQIYDFVDDATGIYTVMDFIEGEALSALLEREGALPRRQAIKYATQLSEVVAYLHTRTPMVIHSDIKPANIMITPEDNICLIDFNVSLMLSGRENVPIGASEGYAPPEQYSDAYIRRFLEQSETKPANESTEIDAEWAKTLLEGASPSDEKEKVSIGKLSENKAYLKAVAAAPTLDIYSIGATLLHMLTGERPPHSLNSASQLAELEERKFGPGLCYIVDTSTAKQPAERFSSAEQMLQVLKNVDTFDGRYKRQRLLEILNAVGILICIIAGGLLVALGMRMRIRERNTSYMDLVNQIGAVHTLEEQANVENLFQDALAIHPYDADAYHAKAIYLYQTKQYESCIDFSIHALNEIEDSERNQASAGDLYYLIATCYFDSGKTADAILYYEEAIRYNKANSDYFRDYAIALARNGAIEDAQSALDTAIGLGLQDDSISLVRGEIALMKQEYSSAEQFFLTSLQTGQQEETRYRALMMLNRLYQMAEGHISNATEKNVQILLQYRSSFDTQYRGRIREALAQAYVALGDKTGNSALYLNALEIYDSIWNSGDKRYAVGNNLAQLYKKTGQLDAAESLLMDMSTLFPEQYGIYRQLAYLEIEKQAALPNEQRNYTLFDEYYQEAIRLFEAADAPKDIQMEQLTLLHQDIEAGGWL